MREDPIACSLTPHELRDRRAVWERISADIEERRRVPDGFAVAYRATPEARRVLPALVAAESDCCGFANWSLQDRREMLELVITGADENVEALAAMFQVL